VGTDEGKDMDDGELQVELEFREIRSDRLALFVKTI
jgi:hypothetical protein